MQTETKRKSKKKAEGNFMMGTFMAPEFNKTLTKLSKQDLPLAVAYKVKNIMKCIIEEQKTFFEMRNTLTEKYGDKNKDGKVEVKEDKVHFSGENAKKFAKEFKELCAIKIKTPTIRKGELGGNVTLSASDLLLLEDIILD